MIVVNCAAIPDNLLESELFGYEKGAFTGAQQTKPGKFELAEGGTMVFDEIGEMSPALQAKLLRLIETKELERLGDVRTRKADVRVVATTNRDLQKERGEGKFREDLFYRISQMHINVPPLRERRDDIPVLVEYFLLRMASEEAPPVRVNDRVMDVFLDYPWPGNVRELLNVTKRAAVLCEKGIITVDDLPLHLKEGQLALEDFRSDGSLDEAISEFERQRLVEALGRCAGSQVKAAKLLGISERSMWYRVKKYNLESP